MYALDDEKRIVQLELEASQQQIDNLHQRLQHLQTQLNIHTQQQQGQRSTPGRAAHDQWDALLVRENHELRHKIELLLQEKEQIEADRRNEVEQIEMKLIERQVSYPARALCVFAPVEETDQADWVQEQIMIEARERTVPAEIQALKIEVSRLRSGGLRPNNDRFGLNAARA